MKTNRFRQESPSTARRPRTQRASPRVEALELREVPSGSSVFGFDPVTGSQAVLPHDPQFDDAVRRFRIEGFAGLGEQETPPPGGPREYIDGFTSIFGPDDRGRVNATTTYPWRTVGRMTMSAGACSGAMVSAYHFLTAGHCVHGGQGSGWFSNFQIALGQYDVNYRPYGVANGIWVRTYTNWTNNSDPNSDFALVTLDRRVGNTTGWLGREWYSSDSVYDGMLVNSAGYPGDKPVGTMWNINGPVDYANASRLFYNGTMDTFDGQSGSAVWRYDGTNRYVNAVHTNGAGGSHPNHNAGCRMTESKFNNVTSWINEDNSVRPPTDRADLTDYDDWYATDYATFSPATVRPGQSFTKSARILNLGTATAASYRVSFYASTDSTITTADTFLGEDTLTAHAPYTWQTASVTANFPNLAAGQYYFGWIIDRLNQVTEFIESNNVAVKTSARIQVLPAAPAGLTGIAVSTSQINLSWTDVSGETGYKVERSPNGSSGWVQVGTTAANVVTFSNTGLASGTLYYYRVRAYHSVTGNGDYSAVENTTTYVAAPATLTATPASSYRINLSWTDVTGEQGYRVERSPNGTTNWTQLGQTGANVTTYADTFYLAMNTVYYYRVRAFNVAGNGAYSPTASAQTLALGSFRFTLNSTTVTAGQPFGFTVAARDTAGNIAINYVGTVTFSTSDPSGGTLPPDTTFTAADDGVRAFSGVSLYVAGNQTIRVRSTANPAIIGVTPTLTVNPGPAYYFYVYEGDASGPPLTVTQNQSFPFYLFPYDEYFNWITNYAGRLTFFSYDPLAVYPASYRFNGTEGGVGVPGNLSFGTLGIQELWVTENGGSAFGLGLYNVIAPDGSPGPGRQGPGAADAVDLLQSPARLAPPVRLDLPLAPALDLGAVERLFASSGDFTKPATSAQLLPARQPAAVATRLAALIHDEWFQVV